MVEARCPICGKLYNITDGRNRWGVEGLFLKHKDNCRLPEPGELVRVMSAVAMVVAVYPEAEEWPVVEVRFPSGRVGEYRLSALGGFVDQDAAAERWRRQGGEAED